MNQKMKIRTYFITIVFSIFFLQIVLASAADAANTIMPLGDSITNGNGSGADPDTTAYYVSYRKALWDKLLAAGYDIDFVGSLNSGSAIFGALEPADHDGHPGWTADEIVNGRLGSGEGKLDEWLLAEEPDIVLLHIGTNDVSAGNQDWNEVEAILDVIDDYEESPSGNAVWVILSLIIDRSCDPSDLDYAACLTQSAQTTTFNDDVFREVWEPRRDGGVDKIVLVDMENGAGIDYNRTTDNPPGDMWNKLHPYSNQNQIETGYTKMADLWFTGLMQILPQAVADANPTNPKETTMVTLDGSNSSDPDGTTLTYLWEQLPGGTQVTLTNPDKDTATFTAPFVGPNGETLTFKLTVTDNDGLESTDTVSIDVINTISPVADAGDPQTTQEGNLVTLDGINSYDPDGGTIVSYLWEEVTTTGVTINNDTSTPTATFTAPPVTAAGETLIFKLTVTDDDGLTDSDDTTVTVNNNPIAPTADAGPDQEVNEGNPVTLDGAGSTDSDGTITTYQWEQLPGGTPVQLSGASTDTATFTAPDVGPAGETLIFKLTVTDDDGLINTDTVSITVRNPTSSDGGGGGGGGCFIGTAADGTLMASHDKVLRGLQSQSSIMNWKRRIPGDLILLTPRAEQAATLAIVVAMVVLICSFVAINLRKPRKRWLKLYHRDRLKVP